MVFLISDGFLALFAFCIFAAGFSTAISVLEWFIAYWWILAIISGLFVLIKPFVTDYEPGTKVLFFICDIIKNVAAYYSIMRYANDCIIALQPGGITGILGFVLEIIAGGFGLFAFLGVGTYCCIGATGELDDYVVRPWVYIMGTVLFATCAGLYYFGG